MESLGVAANVIAVIDLSAQVAKLCYQYSTAVAGARADIERLLSHIKKLHAVLEAAQELLRENHGLRENASNNDGQSFPTFSGVADTLDECKLELQSLQTKLDPDPSRSRMRRVGLRALQWPFKNKEVDAVVQRLERYQTTITNGLQIDQTRLLQMMVKMMEKMTIQLAESVPAVPAGPDLSAAHFTVPFPRDAKFIDRPALLARVKEQYESSSRRTALIGMGGFGKSQIAIEFAYRVQETSPDTNTSVFWVHGGTRARFEESYRSLADHLEIPRRHEPSVDVLVLVRNWLAKPDLNPWLMVLDNADDAGIFFPVITSQKPRTSTSQEKTPEPLASYLPKTGNGRILVTTRSMNAAEKLTGSHRSVIHIPAMDDSEALELFQKSTNVASDEEAAKELVQLLDFIPLAVAQAAAYIDRRSPRLSTQSYLDSFRKNEKRKGSLLNNDSGDLRRDESASNSVVITWQIIFDQIRRESPPAAALLSLMSFFHSQNIPEDVLPGYSIFAKAADSHPSQSSSDGKLDEDEVDDEDIDEDLETLIGYSLISPTTSHGFFDMHPLVQFCTQTWLSEFDDMHCWKEHFLNLAIKHFPSGEFKTWERCQMLLPHFQKLVDEEASGSRCRLPWSELLHNVGLYMHKTREYSTAQKLLKISVKVRRDELGEEHDTTLDSMRSLAAVYSFTGPLREAEELIKYVLDKRRRLFADDHDAILSSEHILSIVYFRQGLLADAVELQMRTLDARRRIDGDESPETLSAMINLASMHGLQRQYKKAEKLLTEALNISLRLHGDGHPRIITCMTNLASTHKLQGQYQEAESLYLQSWEMSNNTYGTSSPQSLLALSMLAWTVQEQGRNAEAKELCLQAILLINGLQSELDEYTASCMSTLAQTCRALGLHAESLALMQQNVSLRRGFYGENHDKTLSAMLTLARWEHAEACRANTGTLSGNGDQSSYSNGGDGDPGESGIRDTKDSDLPKDKTDSGNPDKEEGVASKEEQST